MTEENKKQVGIKEHSKKEPIQYRCPSCSALISEDDRYCRACGAELEWTDE